MFAREKSLLPQPRMHCLCFREMCCDSILLDHKEKQKSVSAQTIRALQCAVFTSFSSVLKHSELFGIFSEPSQWLEKCLILIP